MDILFKLVVVVQILSAVAMIGLILMQHGKGADMGAAFGSGASGSLFGASGSANFLSRSTAILATVFLACTLGLSYFGFSARNAPSSPSSSSVLDRMAAPAAPAASGAASATGAAAIPSGAAAPAPDASAPAAPAVPAAPAASGAEQIPGR